MMKNNFKLNVLMATTLIGASISVLPLGTFAESTGDKNYTSDGKVVFEPDTTPTNPLEPINPNGGEPIIPGDQKPGTSGPLSIDYASSLDFGTQKISSQDKDYKAKPMTYKDSTGKEKTGPNDVQITDNRGTKAGWTLQVKQDGQFKTADNQELTGAQITFNNGHVISTSNDLALKIKPETIVMTPGQATNVMGASAGHGAGTYIMAWGDKDTADSSIHLSVPGKTDKYAKEYKTTFTWTLTETPTND
ncbi:WxL domain-containing protein [Melissococcus plutonius]|uniref:WxL domain-containing protein n=1 Tax=Melissococcus plutonius TaxID=33970 RepID=A0A2Z5Y4E6_9ENTE|nr:WxL domain-containing protein [Melissococcus plutonius]BAL62945.1 hypothetical protein MPD5_1763 [Melissococcus plutonius DAT561]MCV2498901.1 WxL domain-containing protein [Melissococcus plutonius]MCV2501870.1 WxL domain-containing protein [Melissococcus plutonius]MCV2505787.1 WxL domain-containing protein [Melissococcus plutonius]MCV2508106.1 WxL domain-containing protein [Melissococcus plutonius]